MILRRMSLFARSSECGPGTSVTCPGVANIGSHCLKNLFYWQIYTAHLMDFLSSNIVSDNIVSDYPVLRGGIFAKLSFQPTLKLARCYLSLLQTGPRSYFLKLVSSCYFFPRTDDGRICWKFQISPWQRQNHCYVCFAQVPNIFNLLSYKIFPEEYTFRSAQSLQKVRSQMDRR